jgi:hypothetical protein
LGCATSGGCLEWYDCGWFIVDGSVLLHVLVYSTKLLRGVGLARLSILYWAAAGLYCQHGVSFSYSACKYHLMWLSLGSCSNFCLALSSSYTFSLAFFCVMRIKCFCYIILKMFGICFRKTLLSNPSPLNSFLSLSLSLFFFFFFFK